MHVEWSLQALEDIVAISTYIAEDKVSVAEKWVEKIFKIVKKQLSTFPESGRIVPEINNNAIREIFFGIYRIIYRVEKNKVYVITVWHSNRLLKPELIN